MVAKRAPRDSIFPDIGWIDGVKFADETKAVTNLLADLRADDVQLRAIEDEATALVETFRATPQNKTLLDSFLQEYGLSNSEGIALMCLAEALLRIPDTKTRDDFIADRLSSGEWSRHLGESEALMVNASTWGLMLTGKVIALDHDKTRNPAGYFKRLTNRLGEPVIRLAVSRAMQILGGEFVLGETIEGAIRRGRKSYGPNQLYSFDMLGEGARTHGDAERYFEAYKTALAATAAMKQSGSTTTHSGISVKLSALYPRYEFAHREEVLNLAAERFLILARTAQARGLKIIMDAEEADRLGLSLEIFEKVARTVHTDPSPDATDWPGLGLAIQAYGKRARRVIAWVAALGRDLNCRFMVRLVKGAYWDAEIKHAQELGLPDFPVFTRKSTTDLSYLVCAQDMLDNSDVLFCQFATHNAHTIAAIMSLGAGQTERFEFQRLYGMGEGIYRVAAKQFADLPPVRIYAPVGGHKDLLAYLVRRLLENGANSSFVNRFMDADVPAADVVTDPVRITQMLKTIPHPSIKQPAALFGERRENSRRLDLTNPMQLAALSSAQDAVYAETFTARSVCAGIDVDSGHTSTVRNPALTDDILGQCVMADPAKLDAVFAVAREAQRDWNARGGPARAAILRKAADLLDARRLRFMAILSREAGKTQDDAVAEVREAIDFLRYYAEHAEREFGEGVTLPGPSGESNSLHLVGRGVFIAISPWNFPLAIYLGQISAALAAGNSVIAKPAEQTSIIAVEASKLLIEAGIPEQVLMTVLGDGSVGAALVEHKDAAGVAFTGSTLTAKRINLALAEKPGPIVPLIAETGGQNVMFVDSTALLEQVTDDVITSAFKSAGQRCSALRVLYLQTDIADAALQMIQGMMDTLKIGDPRHLSTDIGPVIDLQAQAALNAHVDRLSALGCPHHVSETPDIPSGTFVMPQLFEIDSIDMLERENFGPILHVIRYAAADLDTAIASAFSTGFGLTLGVHTRMESRWEEIFRKAPVGNTYVNRNMTGAVVGSQPFGGQGLSGTGFKAGGPRYLYRFATEKTLTVNTTASGGNNELLTLD